MVSVETAVAREQKQLIRDWERDGAGRRKPGTDQPFPLDANPRRIGQESVGLGIDFTSLQLFAFLLAGLAVVTLLHTLYPLANNASSSVFTQTFTTYLVQTDARTGARSVVGTPVQCDRTYDTASWILDTSVGSYCSNDDTASLYNCPVACVYEVQSGDDLDPGCGVHKPCGLDLNAEDSAKCCVDELDVEHTRDVPAGVFWMNFVGVLGLAVWLVLFQKVYNVSSEQINANTVSAGDFSVLVTGLPVLRQTEETREDVAAFFAHYGEVANVTMGTNVGTLIGVNEELVQKRRQLAELDACLGTSTALDGVWGKLYLKFVTGGKKDPGETKAELEQKIQELETKMRELERMPMLNNGFALVTFSYEMQANNCFRDQRRGVLKDAVSACTGGGKPLYNNELSLSVVRAPEPSDMLWENSDFTGWPLLERRIRSVAAYIITVGAGIGIQLGFEYLRAQQRDKVLKDQASADSEEEQGLISSTAETAALQSLTIFSGLMVVVINSVVVGITKGLAKYEKHRTRSDMERSIVVRLSIIQVLNAVVAPLIVTSPSNWYAKGGFFEQAFYVQSFNAFLPDMVGLADPLRFIKRSRFAKFVQTQEQLDELFAPNQFVLAERYAAVIKTVVMALLYGPVLPISYMIAGSGLISTYYTDKFIALRRCAAPKRMNSDTAEAVRYLLWGFGLVQIMFSGLIFFAEEEDNRPAYLASLIVYVILFLIPFSHILGYARDREMEEGGAGSVSYPAFLGGARTEGAVDVEEEVVGPLASLQQVAPLAQSTSLGEVYSPFVPASASAEYQQLFIDRFRVFTRPVAADGSLLPGQLQYTGGDRATRKPAELVPHQRPPPQPVQQPVAQPPVMVPQPQYAPVGPYGQAQPQAAYGPPQPYAPVVYPPAAYPPQQAAYPPQAAYQGNPYGAPPPFNPNNPYAR